jgi:hypothetical protein
VAALIAMLALCACGTSNNGNTDAGQDGDGSNGRTPCIDDADCQFPETCEDDGYCDLTIGPKPTDNRASGSFDLTQATSERNIALGDAQVMGKLSGQYVFLHNGYSLVSSGTTPTAFVSLYGYVTSNLLHFLEFQIPVSQIQPDQPIEFGGGSVIGTMDLVEVDNDGNELSRHPIAEVIDGHVTFGQFGAAQGDIVEGTFVVDFRPIGD